MHGTKDFAILFFIILNANIVLFFINFSFIG